MLVLGTTLLTNILEKGQCQLPSVLHTNVSIEGFMGRQHESVLAAAGSAC